MMEPQSPAVEGKCTTPDVSVGFLEQLFCQPFIQSAPDVEFAEEEQHAFIAE